jgi:hypothetical protein
MSNVTRREFLRTATLAAAAAQLTSSLRSETAAPPTLDAGRPADPHSDARPEVHWLEGMPAPGVAGVTWGMPWPRGKHPKQTTFGARTSSGAEVPLQSWPLATWPDGSLKWTGHALPADVPLAENYAVVPAEPIAPARPLTVTETTDAIVIETGVISCRVGKNGQRLIESITRDGREIARGGRLLVRWQDTVEPAAGASLQNDEFIGDIASIVVEQRGPVRAVVKLEGQHRNAAGRAWLPFVVRLYFYAGGEAVRVMHTFVFDGDEKKDFIAGLGLRFDVIMRDAPYDRHVRFAGEENGLWAEAVQGITGLRRDPGKPVREAQLAGRACPPLDQWAPAVVNGLKYVPVWGDYTLSQLSADGFEIRKRTKPGCSWIKGGYGRRAGGTAYVGGASGGVAFGLRNFWQSHPSQLDVRGASGDEAEVTVWLWSPEAPPMDLRFYHDGMGQDTYAKQLDGLNITYEDYEPGFGTPHGVARTSEITLWAFGTTPTRKRFVELATAVRTPAALVCPPAYYASTGLFGGMWALPDRSVPAKARIEDQLDFYFDYYRKQIEQHHWYGFWNFGDFMHTYDADRHTWRYDVGGYGWDNSELSPDLWLWYSFLRTGRSDIFRVAEAMTRHTGEVDVYHLGRFRGLGSRHNVMHWGDSAKQVRISTAAYRRFYHYLTADERTGDLLGELVDCDERLVTIPAGRKIGRAAGDERYPADVSFGTDWCSFAAAWLTAWERTGEVKWRDKIITGMKSIGTMPNGWFNSGGGYDPATGQLYPHNDQASASHLNAVFGAVEVSAELLQLIDAPEYERAWLQYCEVYNAEPEEQRRLVGKTFDNHTLRQGHSRLTAYAAMKKRDTALAKRAWREFGTAGGDGQHGVLATSRIEGPAALNPLDEAPRVSTNGTAQFGLAAIQCLALVGESLGK